MESLRYFTSLALVCALLTPSYARGQASVPIVSLSTPLMEGSPAPFSGVLMSEDDFRLALEYDASSERHRTEVVVLTGLLEVKKAVYEEFIAEQRARIDALSYKSWWDDNGNTFMLGLGLVLGVAFSAFIVGLATN